MVSFTSIWSIALLGPPGLPYVYTPVHLSSKFRWCRLCVFIHDSNINLLVSVSIFGSRFVSLALKSTRHIRCVPGSVCINPGRASTGPDVLDTLKVRVI